MAIDATTRRTTTPSVLTRFKKVVLHWDYVRILIESKKKDRSGLGLKRVKSSYESFEEYIGVFEPLLFEEVKAQIVQQTNEEEESGWDKGGIAKCIESDGFHKVDLVVRDVFQEEVSENDLLILSEKEFKEGEAPGAYAFALVEHRGGREALALLTFLVGEDKHLDNIEAKSNTRLLKMLSVLKESDRILWIKKICSLSTIMRDYVALHSVTSLPFKDLILSASEKLNCISSDDRQWNVPRPLMDYLKNSLNDSQLNAIHVGLSRQSFVLIQGPPGTGKTQTILGLLSAVLHSSPARVQSRGQSALNRRLEMPMQDKYSNWTKASPWLTGLSPRDLITPSDDDEFLPIRNELKPEVVNSNRKHRVHVLVCAPSNSALDEIVLRLLHTGIHDENNHAYNPKIVRIGLKPHHSVKAVSLDYLVEQRLSGVDRSSSAKTGSGGPLDRDRIRASILDEAAIVFSTLSFSGSALFTRLNRIFDVVIIDEAAQAVEPATLVPLAHGCRQVFLVGDPVQLPATVISPTAERFGYGTSLFKRFQGAGFPVQMLRTQYRMHPQISIFPSKEFYDGFLENGDLVERQTKRDWHAYSCFGPFSFFDVDGVESQPPGSGSWVNEDEVDFIVLMYHKLASQYPELKSGSKLAVISPYRHQVKLLRDRFRATFGEMSDQVVDINTVDGFQGREKDVAIFSCVRSNTGKGIGFVSDFRRMNVGITRAKSSVLKVNEMSTIGSSRNKVVIAGTLTPLSFVRRYLKEGDIELLREEYHLIDLLFSIEEFHAQGPTLLYLIERGHVESKRGIDRRHLEFDFGGRKTYEFGPVEFALMTGLSFGEYPVDDERISKLPALFQKKKKSKGPAITLNDVELLMETLSKSKDNTTLRKNVVLYLLHTIVFSKDKRGHVSMLHVNLVDSPEEFNTYPWGRLIYDEFVRDMHGLFVKFQKEDILMEFAVDEEGKKEKKKDMKKKQLKMSIFPYALQGWLFECLPRTYVHSLAHRKSVVDLPRLKRWNTVGEDYKIARQTIFDVEEVKLTKMTPEDSEFNQHYFKSALVWVNDVDQAGSRHGSSSDGDESGPSSSDEDNGSSPGLLAAEVRQHVTSTRLNEKSYEKRLKKLEKAYEERLHQISEANEDDTIGDTLFDWTQVGDDEGHALEANIGVGSKVVAENAPLKAKDCVELRYKRNRKPGPYTTSPYTPLISVKGKKSKKAEVQLPVNPTRLRATDLKKFVPPPHERPSEAIIVDTYKAARFQLWKRDNQKNKDAKLRLVTTIPAYLSSASFKELTDARGWLTSEHTDAALELLNLQAVAYPELFPSTRWTTLNSIISAYMHGGYRKFKALKEAGVNVNSFQWADEFYDLYRAVAGANPACYNKPWNIVDRVFGIEHLEYHWCAYMIDLEWRRIDVYDSIVGAYVDKRNDAFEELATIIPSLYNAHLSKNEEMMDPSHKFEVNVLPKEQVPQQLNGSDCGVFAIKFVQCLIMGDPVSNIKANAEDVSCYRLQIALSVLMWKHTDDVKACLLEEYDEEEMRREESKKE